MSEELDPMEYVEDWYAALGVDTGGALRRQAQDVQRDGITAGGLFCCGTTGIWHRPWCREDPKHHRPGGNGTGSPGAIIDDGLRDGPGLQGEPPT
jgi:hypothetical protein